MMNWKEKGVILGKSRPEKRKTQQFPKANIKSSGYSTVVLTCVISYWCCWWAQFETNTEIEYRKISGTIYHILWLLTACKLQINPDLKNTFSYMFNFGYNMDTQGLMVYQAPLGTITSPAWPSATRAGLGSVPRGLDRPGCAGLGSWHIAKSRWADQIVNHRSHLVEVLGHEAIKPGWFWRVWHTGLGSAKQGFAPPPNFGMCQAGVGRVPSSV
jgi:hypothetical protein